MKVEHFATDGAGEQLLREQELGPPSIRWATLTLQKAPTVVFKVSNQLQEYTVHTPPFTRLSRQFEMMMGGPYSRDVVIWNDVGVLEFSCLCQFAYIGDYNAPAAPLPSPKNSLLASPGQAQDLESWHKTACYHYTHDPFLSFDPYQEVSRIFDFKMTIALKSWLNSYQVRKSPFRDGHTPFKESETYVENLLCHAKVFALAYRFEVEQLTSLALWRLSETLLSMNFTKVNDIIPVVKYTMECAAHCKELRELLARFVLCVFTRGYREIDAIMESHPQFAADFYDAQRRSFVR
ncbi:hypothetical protein HD806DRAFT_543988 [Xylariaceae sp. AK1471]|nr:hypothetical protein HD806DRAFT_543988 [Xylariaceae sp. AK1471]